MLHPLPLIYFVLSVVLRPWETLLSLPRLAPWGEVPTPGGGEGGGILIAIPEDDTFRNYPPTYTAVGPGWSPVGEEALGNLSPTGRKWVQAA